MPPLSLLLFCHSILLLIPPLHASPPFSLCPPTGPVLPPPVLPAVPNPNTWASLTNALTTFLLASEQPDSIWNSSTTSFSIAGTTADADFFEYHHTSSLRNSSGVFNVLAVLLEEEIWLEKGIGEFIPELNGTVVGSGNGNWDGDEWEDVTVRMLMSQIGAIPRNGYTFDSALNSDDLVELGFPALNDSDIPPCSLAPGMRMCSHDEFFASFSEFPFTGAIGDRAAYSDLAYILLGYALENVTGLSFEAVLKEKILDPLGLSDTGISNPGLSRSVIPLQGGLWVDADWAYYDKTAGMYSTTSDLTKFIRAIYNHTLLPPSQTNSWLKPSVFTSQLDNSVGAPWEIFRPTTLLPPLPGKNGSRPIDHYTKSGDLPGFSSSYLVLVPEFELGVTILGMGPDASVVVPLLLDLVQKELVPVFEELARGQAEGVYAGRYESGVSNGVNGTGVIELAVDEGPGLKVGKWMNGEIDMLRSLDVVMFGSEIEEAIPVDVRFYPLGVDERWYVGWTKVQAERMGGIEEKPGALRGGACMPWFSVDKFHYGKRRVDEVVFIEGQDGKVEGLDVPWLRETFDKVE
ncbi:beta-lactamase/transpeptidase-like protein [Aspergillus spectabilis]